MGDLQSDASGDAPRVVWFGGDYNPEQWPDGVRAADLAAMEHLGANTVTLGVFNWALIQPAKGSYEFAWLDRVVDDLAAAGIGIILATPTAAQPAWMSAAFPEILPVDEFGRRRRHGGRVNYCPSSTAYREACAEVAGALAERFGGHEALRLWHVNNEYGPVCFCDRCLDDFRRWVAVRYGDLATLNEAWGTTVWGNTLTDWSEIELPSQLNSMDEGAPGRVRFTANPSLSLDHARYCSTVLLECFLNEKSALRGRSPDVPVTTNFHGPVQVVDWHQWAEHLDLVSWDSYPVVDGHWAHPAFGHDLARGAGGGEFLIMEAAPGPVNWHDRCALKRPGRVRLEGLQAVSRGSRGMLYFQVRQARAGAELNHSALIPRHGRLDTRTGEELTRLGAHLGTIGVLPDRHTIDAAVALVFDWPSWWSQHNTPGLDQRSRYLETVRDVHRAIAERGRVVDVVGTGEPFDGYAAVVAPLLHVIGEPTLAHFADFVSAGGTLVTTTGSGVVGDSGLVDPAGAAPTWRQLLGLWVEETDVQPATAVNRVVFADGSTIDGRELFDIVRLEGAEEMAEFGDDFYAGSPAIAVNRFGGGTAVYVACLSGDLVAGVLDRHLPPVASPVTIPDTSSVERVRWASAEDETVCVLNHGDDAVTIGLDAGTWIDVLTGRSYAGSVRLPGADAFVLRRIR
jgi:beta-galactosidase